MTPRLVVVGNGMASLRFVERLGERAPGRFAVTVIGEEPAPAYNRVLLSSLLAGDADEDACRFRDRAWYAEQGVALRTGSLVSAIDRSARTVRIGDEDLPYDRLVLATGSVPIRLPLPGADLPGVIAFRDLTHIDAMRRVARPGAHAVVIGGGLLGLEAAYGMTRLGVSTTLIHVMDRLMERQLDGRAAGLVLDAMKRKGMEVLLETQTEALLGDGAVRAVRLADGRELPADLVVMAVGVRPRIDLARDAGLAVGRGIQVDDGLATSDPAIAAVGECIEHRGAVYGLIEPGYEQADILARRLAGDAGADYRGSSLATSLKVSGLPVFSAGEFADGVEGEPIVFTDRRSGAYRKLVVRDGRLVGAVLVGDVGEGPWYRELIVAGTPVDGFRQSLMFGRPAATSGAGAPLPLAA